MLKKILYILFVLFFFSCSDSEDVDNMQDDSKVTLISFIPTLEISSEPLSRGNVPNGIFAINILWKNFTGSFEPYASGLFDDMSKAKIQLINGHLYRITCSFIQQNELPYFKAEKGYGAPFNLKDVDYSPVLNTMIVDPAPFSNNNQFYSGSYYGTTRTSENVLVYRPAIHRLYGVAEVNLTDKNDNELVTIPITLRKAYYTLQLKHDGLDDGDSLKIALNDDVSFVPFVFKGVSKDISQLSEPRLMTMKNITTYPNGGNNFGDINASDEVILDIKYKKKDADSWIDLYYSYPHAKLKRNCNNIITIKDVDKKIENILVMTLDEDELNNNDIDI